MKEKGEALWHNTHANSGHFLIIVGILVLAYGIINYLRITYSWPAYAGWVAGGIVLIALGLVKKYWWK
jgi:uncharacterized membrane protein YidH (DUF202 family)